MTDCGDHRRIACEDRSGDFLLVEGPKVFDRTAAAPDNQDIQSHRIKRPDSFYDAVLCAVSLNQGRVEDQLDIWIPSVGDIHDIPDRSSRGRCDDSHGLCEPRDRPLILRVKHPHLFQLF